MARGRSSRRIKRSQAVSRRDVGVNLREPKSPIYTISRLVDFGPVTKAATDSGYGQPFSLGLVTSSTDFTNLFNQWRIRAVEFEFILTTPNVTTALPNITYVVDHNDATAPAFETDLLQYGNAEFMPFSSTNVMFKRTLAPNAALAAYQGTFTAYSTAPKGQFFDTAYPNIQYYGVKYWINNYNTGSFAGTVVRTRARIHFDFKLPR